jgi:hypothetical protein
VQLKINSCSSVFTSSSIADNGLYRTPAFIICDWTYNKSCDSLKVSGSV